MKKYPEEIEKNTSELGHDATGFTNKNCPLELLCYLNYIYKCGCGGIVVV